MRVGNGEFAGHGVDRAGREGRHGGTRHVRGGGLLTPSRSLLGSLVGAGRGVRLAGDRTVDVLAGRRRDRVGRKGISGRDRRCRTDISFIDGVLFCRWYVW